MTNSSSTNLVTSDPWQVLRSATSARIALGRAGGSLPTSEWLNFKTAHAAARDAVHAAFNVERMTAGIAGLGIEVRIVNSAAADRRTFLLQPELGRQLDEASRYQLQQLPTSAKPDLAISVSDGLSAIAAERPVGPVLEKLVPMLTASGWRLAPVIVARFGRVALEDEIGQVLGAELALMLIGERPGLGAPDSLGAYLVFAPRVGNTDARRNCVSNIRPDGLPHAQAAETILYLLTEAKRRRLSGVGLKDDRTLDQRGNASKQIS
jgi:ethanolamine ammonia-lyase small subunit